MNKSILYMFVFFICILFNSQKVVYLEKEEKLFEVEFYSRYTSHSELVQKINNINQYYNVELPLLISLMYAESQYDSKAINNRNINGSVDSGLFQLNSNHFRSPYIFDEVVNISNGAAHLEWCLNQTKGDMENALRLYNGGYYKRNEKTERHVAYIINYYVKMKLAYMSYSEEK